MNALLLLAGLSLPIFVVLVVLMWRSQPQTTPGKAAMALYAILLAQLVLILFPIPILRFTLPVGLQNLLQLLQSAAAVMITLDGLLFLAAGVLLGIAWWLHEHHRFIRISLIYAGLSLALNPFLLLWTVAGTETWFVGAVPIEQRLVSHNDAIRKKAQQELLGLTPDARRQVTEKLIPELSQDSRFVRKWAAISLALIGPAAQEAIPALLPGVSAPEKDVAEAYRVALSEIGSPDPSQLPSLMDGLGDSRDAVRCESAAAIARLGSAAATAVPILVARIKESPVFPSCMGQALADLSDLIPEVSSSVYTLLSDPALNARINAASTLGLFKEKQTAVIDGLLGMLSFDANGDGRRAAAQALALPEVPDRGAIPSLSYAFRHSRDSAVRLEAFQQLSGQWPIDQAGPIVSRALARDPNPFVRRAIVFWLTNAGPSARGTAPALLDALHDDDLLVRRGALQALHRLNARPHNLAGRLALAQRDPDPVMRCQAAQQLTDIGAADRVAVAVLIRDLKSQTTDSDCAARALEMAGHFNGDVVPALVSLLGENQVDWRSEAAHLLMQLGPKARTAMPALTQAAKDGVPGAETALRVLRETVPRASHRRRN